MTAAKQIYQKHLDAVSKAFWNGELSVAAGMMAFPHSIVTTDGEQAIETPEEFVESLRVFRASLKRLGTTEYHRICAKAQFAPGQEDVINGSHHTHALNGGTYVLPPLDSSMTLIQSDGKWYGAGIHTEVRNHDCTIYAAHSDESDIAELPADHEAETIYQENLDRVSEAFWARDWDQMLRHMLPGPISTTDYFGWTDSDAALIESQTALRDSFDRLNATEYHRVCKGASFLPGKDGVIVGRHKTYVLRGGHLVIPPYDCNMRIRRDDGVWKCFGLRIQASDHDLQIVTRPPSS